MIFAQKRSDKPTASVAVGTSPEADSFSFLFSLSDGWQKVVQCSHFFEGGPPPREVLVFAYARIVVILLPSGDPSLTPALPLPPPAPYPPSSGNLVVGDAQLFAAEVLPRHFGHSNFSSFRRQLRCYAFKKIGSANSSASPFPLYFIYIRCCFEIHITITIYSHVSLWQ